MGYRMVPQAYTSVEVRETAAVQPPALPPLMASLVRSAVPSSARASATAAQSSTSTTPHCSRSRLRYSRPYPVDPP